jgi:hypothetical protein
VNSQETTLAVGHSKPRSGDDSDSGPRGLADVARNRKGGLGEGFQTLLKLRTSPASASKARLVPQTPYSSFVVMKH